MSPAQQYNWKKMYKKLKRTLTYQAIGGSRVFSAEKLKQIKA
jgi:hypothetical protein